MPVNITFDIEVLPRNAEIVHCDKAVRRPLAWLNLCGSSLFGRYPRPATGAAATVA